MRALILLATLMSSVSMAATVLPYNKGEIVSKVMLNTAESDKLFSVLMRQYEEAPGTVNFKGSESVDSIELTIEAKNAKCTETTDLNYTRLGIMCEVNILAK